MKISALLTTVLCAASMVWAQSSGAYNDKNQDKNRNKQAQTDQNSKRSTPQETVDSTTKTTPSDKVKTKTVSVIGRVKSFESGKKLVVTTPKKHTRPFDLNAKNTTVNGGENVKPGEMVKVTEKTENGQHTINIEPYTRANANGSSANGDHMANHGHPKKQK